MKKNYKIIVRTPLQSIESLARFDVEKMPVFFSEAISVASPSLYNQIKKYNTLSEGEKYKIKLTLLKYWKRSCTRATPYGLFSGGNVVGIGETQTEFKINSENKITTHIRLDMGIIQKITDFLVGKEEVLFQLKVTVNTSLYESETEYRYVEYKLVNGVRKYELTSISKTNELIEVIKKVNNSKLNFTELVTFVIEITKKSHEVCKVFCINLIHAQILETDLSPNLSGNDPLSSLIEKMTGMNYLSDILNSLKKIFTTLKVETNSIEIIKIIKEELLSVGIDIAGAKDIIQVDSFINMIKPIFNKEIHDEILKQIEDLFYLSRKYSNPNLENFKNLFTELYEDQEVALTKLIDPDMGLGYNTFNANSLGNLETISDLPDLVFMPPTNSNSDIVTQFIYKKFNDYINKKAKKIEITQDDIRLIKRSTRHMLFNEGMSAFGELFSKEKEIDHTNFCFYIKSIGGSSAVNLINRFTLQSDEYKDLVKEIVDDEQISQKNVILADIVHFPQERVGNIILKKNSREYEIPYLGNSSLLKSKQININDLFVSIKNNKIILRSKKLNKRIIPILSNSHNYSYKSLPIYNFLCDLQNDNKWFPNIWDWGELSNFDYLPRVEYKNLIIKKARWVVKKVQFNKLKKEQDNLKFLKDFKKWYNLPDRIFIVQDDLELHLDLTEESSAQLLDTLFKKNYSLILEEFLVDELFCPVKDSKGENYLNELIIPFIRQSHKYEDVTQNNVTEIQRNFILGSEWVYFKIYSGVKIADEILVNNIIPLLEENKSLYECFFFIRYKDDFNHLRLRFKSINPKNRVQLLLNIQECCIKLQNTNVINKIVYDTYQRELERYHYEVIVFSEDVFYYDSVYVLRLLDVLKDVVETEKYKLLLTLRSINAFLDDFEYCSERKLILIEKISINFLNEFGGDKHLRDLLNKKYGKYKKDIFSHLNADKDFENGISEVTDLINERSKNIRLVFEKMKSKVKDEVVIDDLVGSYLHMHINRIFIVNQRKYELAIYYFLFQYLKAISFIKKNNFF